jgi:UDP-2,4-diacetamido-2,4,6-trideoxy-beta-L-altropyranose hydrolase
MRIVFRADSSVEIGSGHIIRCAVLARQLLEMGADVRFLCRELPGHRIQWLESQGFSVDRIPFFAKPNGSPILDLNFNDLQESRATLELQEPMDWIVVDHYQLDWRWEQGVRDFTKKILVIDDLANRAHDADMLVDCSVVTESADYSRLLPSGCELLIGGSYALLGKEFALNRIEHRRTFAKRKKLHIALGGGHASETMPFFLEWMLRGIEDVKFHVLVNSKKVAEKLETFPSQMRSRFSFEYSPSDVVSGMRQCDVSVGAPGGMTWERFCLGLPFAAVATHPTQLPILNRLEKKGWLLNLGSYDSLGEDSLSALRDWLKSDLQLERMRRNIQIAVDGLGTKRVADSMYGRTR